MLSRLLLIMKPLALAMLYYAVQSEESKSGLSTTYWVWQEQQQQKLLLTKAILLTRLLLRDPIIKHEKKNALEKNPKALKMAKHLLVNLLAAFPFGLYC